MRENVSKCEHTHTHTHTYTHTYKVIYTQFTGSHTHNLHTHIHTNTLIYTQLFYLGFNFHPVK